MSPVGGCTVRAWGIAATAAALVACTEPVEVHVVLQPTGGQIHVIRPGCECDRGIEVPLGGDVIVVERSGMCACAVPADHCARVARIDHGGASVRVGATWTGEFPGGRLVFDGCGTDLDVVLPSAYPAPPTVADMTVAGVRTVTWDVDARTDSVTLAFTSGNVTRLQRFAATAGAQAVTGAAGYQLVVSANLPVVEQHTVLGRTLVLATSPPLTSLSP